ncbi:L-aspartate oxidase [Propionibacteriaceae bacterium Y2011]|uniref:L-aspartate oxidase n=1 Tax=Microlunatus sp. Y2014 TaxID=3418488 RepID=UPI003B4FA991
MNAQQRCDVIVIGTGAAGLAAALRLADASLDTVVITKGALGGGSTAWAQGGLAAALAADDSTAAHAHDTVVAGAGLCAQDVVTDLVTAAPKVIRSLLELGARFDRSGQEIALGLEGGHSARRIVHAGGDATGAEVSRVLSRATGRAVEAGRLRLVEHQWCADLLTEPTRTGTQPAGGTRGVGGTRVVGVTTLAADGTRTDWQARVVVLAAGGSGQVWSATTNPESATGDGLAMALRAGAVVRDVEFMQFHPTLLAAPAGSPDDRGVLVSEAVRGEGATLRTPDGRPVMAGVHPRGDLAPRDVVSATMQQVMLRDGFDHLVLDGTHLGADGWAEHFPTIAALCRERGVDPATEPIPVRPGAHYHCGGVAADLAGHTSLPGLYAVGEVAATGLHGANRLASNSLTEALVAGDRVGRLLAAGHRHDLGRAAVEVGDVLSPAADRDTPVPGAPTVSGHRWIDAGSGHRWIDAGAREWVADMMSRWVGVLRHEDGLARATAALADLPGHVGRLDPATLEATNVALVATAVTIAADWRTESRGCHRRSDHPERRPSWQRHVELVCTEDGRLTVTDAAAVGVA